MKAYIVAEM